MKGKAILVAAVLIAYASALCLSSIPASANPVDTYTIDWYTIDGGGAVSLSGGTYMLSGTLGQADAGTMSGDGYILNGGFWPGAVSQFRVFLPLVLKS